MQMKTHSFFQCIFSVHTNHLSENKKKNRQQYAKWTNFRPFQVVVDGNQINDSIKILINTCRWLRIKKNDLTLKNDVFLRLYKLNIQLYIVVLNFVVGI